MPKPTSPIPDSDRAPAPEPIRFYGTSWVDHTGGYAVRRLGLGLAALVLAAGGTVLLTLVFGGVGTSGWLQVLAVIALVLCAVMAFTRTWNGYTQPAESGADESAFRSIKVVGFVGVFLAYALRTVVEAPGERLRRADYEAALERHRRRIARRSGNPARRRRAGKR